VGFPPQKPSFEGSRARAVACETAAETQFRGLVAAPHHTVSAITNGLGGMNCYGWKGNPVMIPTAFRSDSLAISLSMLS
jgi:hypothetical protein